MKADNRVLDLRPTSRRKKRCRCFERLELSGNARGETMTLSAVIQREDDMFVALCPELDVVSQGETSDQAYANLQEAVELLLEDVSPEELERRSSTRLLNKNVISA